MQKVYIGNTLINDVMLGSQRMDDVIAKQQDLLIEYLIVAGGGAGGLAPGNGIPGSGGGGAGGLRSGSLLITNSNTSYTVQVGPGGPSTQAAPTRNGSPSIFDTITSTGGGSGGGNNLGPTNGVVGGSGGGGGGTTGILAAGTANQGFSGSNSNGSTICGGGGGASGNAGTGSFQGGSGSGSIWLDNLEYSIGGGGDGSSYNRYNQGAGYGNGGPGTYNNNDSIAGQNGVVKIRYYGAPQAAGGTITTTGSYTYHTYTYSAGVTSSFTY